MLLICIGDEMMYYIEVRNYRGTVEHETQVSSYGALVKRLEAIMRNYFYAIDVFTILSLFANISYFWLFITSSKLN